MSKPSAPATAATPAAATAAVTTSTDSARAKSVSASVASRTWTAWLPGQCEICRLWKPARLCSDCRARHAAPCARCARCGLRTGLGVAACGECLQDPPPFQRTCCAVDYVFPWVQLLQDFKFHSQDDLARPLAQLMADAVRSSFSPAPAESSRAAALPDLLLPVPLSADRLRERGYNQAWELARQLGRLLDRPARSGVLQRVQQGPAQAGLSRAQRQRNLLGAFCVTPSGAASLQGRHVALVDDVMTTGATVREATQTVLQAGAARVDVWVLARTPTPTA